MKVDISTLVDKLTFKIADYFITVIGVPTTIFATIYAKIKAQ